MEDTASSFVCSVTVSGVISGSVRMPFLKSVAWQSAQHDSLPLPQAYAHLTQGTCPSKKTKNIKDLCQYLNVASVSQNGLLVVRKS